MIKQKHEQKQKMKNGLWRGFLLSVLMTGLVTGEMALTVAAADRQTERQKKSSEKSNRPLLVYRLEFTVDEFIEGKRTSTRTFTMMMKEGETSRVRMGTRVLISAPDAEAKYLDLGLKFDGRVEERDELIVLDGKLDLNDPVLPAGAQGEGKTGIPAVIHNFQAEVETAIPAEKNTLLGVYDDSVSKRRYELRATITKIKAMLANQ
jgi:hypothetical protein